MLKKIEFLSTLAVLFFPLIYFDVAAEVELNMELQFEIFQ